MKMITDAAALADICAEFSEASYITVDTEFMRERTYWSKLCLVQMARPGSDEDSAVLIDPLADGMDLSPLLALMTDPGVVKVFHAARQDIEIFHNIGGIIPAPLFDTQVAAMVCGYGDQVGYETLVRRVAKAEIDKSSRFTDWSRRPLNDKQLRYALADVTFLRQIYEVLSARIDESGRAHWVSEELAILTDPATYEADPAQAWRRVKVRSNNQRMLGVVRALAHWREELAQQRDVPRSRIMKDDALIEIATARPKTADDLGRLRLVQREARKAEMAEQILEVVEQAMARPLEDHPAVPEPPRRREGSGAIADLLKVFLKARADEIGVAPKLIGSAADIEALAGEDSPDLALLRGWRREVFGDDALRIRDGQLALAARPGGVRLITLDN